MSRPARGLGRRSARLGIKPALATAEKISTKALLIDTAEQLFGQLGVDGVSLREIGVEAGQANTNVVQYHFKDKAGLVRAILDDRVGRIEALRADRLKIMKSAGRGDPRELLQALWLPILSVRDHQGVHTFCRFLLQLMLQSHVDQHPVHKLYSVSKAAMTGREFSYVAKATRMLRAHYDHMPQAVLNRRLSSLSMMFLATVVEHDNAKLTGKVSANAEPDVDLVLDMALGALAVAP